MWNYDGGDYKTHTELGTVKDGMGRGPLGRYPLPWPVQTLTQGSVSLEGRSPPVTMNPQHTIHSLTQSLVQQTLNTIVRKTWSSKYPKGSGAWSWPSKIYHPVEGMAYT